MAGSNVHLLSPAISDAATLSGGSWRVTAPLANIQSEDVKQVARSTDATEASTRWRLDGGASPPRSWSMFALIGHGITVDGQWCIACTDDPSDAPGNRLHYSGWMPVWQPTVTWGSVPWGAFPWDGVDPTAYPTHPLALYIAPASVLARYVFIYLSDTANPAGYVDIGRFVAGDAWTPEINVAYGLTVRWADPSEPRRTEGGRRIVRQRPRYRAAEMSFENLTPGEAWGVPFEMQRIGKAGTVLFIANPEDAGEIRFKRSFYAGVVENQPISEDAFETLGWRLSLEEII